MEFLQKVLTTLKKRSKRCLSRGRLCKMSVSSMTSDYHQEQAKAVGGGREMKDKAYAICRKFLSGEWNKISPNDMVFKTVSGGLSNYLYLCSLPSTHTPLNGEPSQVLLRMYGQLLNGNDTKVTDSVITMRLSERNLGPKLYGIFPGGRLEEYIPARAMHCRELKVPIYAAAIARKLATVHTLDVPINKEPTWLWDTFNEWLHSVRSNHKRSMKKLERELRSFDFESEIQWLKPFLLSCNSPTVFCHNDLQEGNILVPGNTSITNFDDTIVFIDFEYCAYNHRGHDLGNHFVERMFDYSNPKWPHFYTFPDQYPSDSDKRLFVREYIKSSKELTLDKTTEDQLIKEADYFALASHLLWTLWAINNAQTSTIPFGYLEHAKARLDAYLRHKEWLLKTYRSTV